MLKHKKNIFAFPLLLMVLVPMLVCVFFLLKQHSIKEKMEKKLEQGALTTITLFTKTIQWVSKGKELIIKGELFDVKVSTQKNDSLIIVGLFDYAEKELKLTLASLLGKQKNTNTPLQQLITQFLSPSILTPTIVELNQLFISSTLKKYYTLVENLQWISLDISPLPPNHFSSYLFSL